VNHAEDTTDMTVSISELQALLVGTDSIDGFLQELAVLAARTLGEKVECGITLQPNGRPYTVASSGPLAAQMDEIQYGLDHGPCLASIRTGDETRIDDLATDRRWHRYALRALAHGVRSSLSLPLTAQRTLVGALNLYSASPGFFDQAQTQQARRFAGEASVAVGIAARLAAQAVLTDQLRASLASRSVIDQALGVIMADQRCTAEEAFAILRTASHNRNVKLRQVAQDIVTGITGKPPEPPPFSPPR
jgi:GAF domain-containing protein